jgi:hypothetical protein
MKPLTYLLVSSLFLFVLLPASGMSVERHHISTIKEPRQQE